MKWDASTIGATFAGLATVLTGLAAIVAASRKRDRDWDEELELEVAALRGHVYALLKALARANTKLANHGFAPVDVPVRQDRP